MRKQCGKYIKAGTLSSSSYSPISSYSFSSILLQYLAGNRSESLTKRRTCFCARRSHKSVLMSVGFSLFDTRHLVICALAVW